MHYRASIYFKICIVALSTLCCVQGVHADESIDAILARHAVQDAVKLSYQETRDIQFIDAPVLSSGYMYVSATHFIVEQKKPYRRVVVTDHAKMWVYDSLKHTKRFRNIKRFSNKKSAIGALVFAMRTGEAKALKDYYNMTLGETNLAWSLGFMPIQDEVSQAFERITLHGLKGESANLIEIVYTDGNRTHWKLKKLENTVNLTQKMKLLIKEVRGR